MTSTALVFHPEYAPADHPHFKRLAVVAERLVGDRSGYLVDAPLLDTGLLAGLHDADYIHAFLHGIEPLASSSHLKWTPSLRESCLRMLGGQLVAAQIARNDGLCFNLACGFHHAIPERGGGFCIFNGLALVAHCFPTWRVAVLDCDEHGGDGTEVFCSKLANLEQFSIFGTRFGVRGGVRSRVFAVPRDDDLDVNSSYLNVLDQCLHELVSARHDIVIYQAGMDSHVGDPKSSLKLSARTLYERDRRVFCTLRRAGIPVLVVLAGAYQKSSIVADLYRNTLHAALVSRAAFDFVSGAPTTS